MTIKMKWKNSPRVYEAEDCEGLVNSMRSAGPWDNSDSSREYMEEIARRVKVYKGEKIVFKDEQEFISELERLGLIQTFIEGWK